MGENLPGWVWELLEALVEYEDVHPTLLSESAGTAYVPYPCFHSKVKHLIPESAWYAASVMAHRKAAE